MDILWAISHPPSSSSAVGGINAIPPYMLPGAAAAAGTFAVPTPPYADGSWDMYQDFVGDVQFWGYALVSGSGDGAVRMWDSRCLLTSFKHLFLITVYSSVRTGQAHRTLLGHTAPVTCLQFDENLIISGSLDKSIRVRLLLCLFEISVLKPSSAKMWDLRTGGMFDTLKYDHAVTALQFDSRKIVAATGENGVKVSLLYKLRK